MPRFKNVIWEVAHGGDSNKTSAKNCEEARLAVLMDIRDELQTLNHTLSCRNFLNIPKKLDAIRINTTKKRRTK